MVIIQASHVGYETRYRGVRRLPPAAN
jgi:hypothetical protein